MGSGRLSARENSVKKTLVIVGLFICALSAAQAQKLTGAGATFPNPIYSKWFSEYASAHPGVQINYQSIGSGGGIRQVLAQTVDFGAADITMTDEQLSQAKVKILHIPTVLGAVVPRMFVPIPVMIAIIVAFAITFLARCTAALVNDASRA